MMMKASLIAAALLGVASTADWNYDLHGKDWGSVDKKNKAGNICDTGVNQSPIDLISKMDTLKWKSANYQVYNGKADQFTKVYNNPFEQQVKWNGHTSQVNFDIDGDGTMMFASNIARDVFGASKAFNGVQFHFHSGSEHTVNGIRHDLEMHTVHTSTEKDSNGPKGGFPYAAVGILFSVKDFTARLSWAEQALVDTFFDNLQWDDGLEQKHELKDKHKSQIEVNWIAYADLLTLVDTENRWVYRGSVTTPPCVENVYWNVLSTVYPISEKHLNQFKKYLDKAKIIKEGNYREIQKISDTHDVIYLENTEHLNLKEYQMSESAALIGIVVILSIFLVIFMVASLYLIKILNQERKNSQKD